MARYTKLGKKVKSAKDWETPAMTTFAVLYAAGVLAVWLAVPVWTIQGKTAGILDDWTAPPEGTATEPEPGTKALLWAALGFNLAAAVAAGLSVVQQLPWLIERFANRHAAAGLAWVALVLTAAAADAIVHHVAANVGASTGGVAPIGLGLAVAMLAFLATVEFWEHLTDE